MTDAPPEMHRTHHDPAPEHVEVRDDPEVADRSGVFAIRLPVTSTAEARDGEAFTRDRLRGFRDQIDAGDVGVFLDHGRNTQTGSRYSALGKIGYWAAPELVERDGAVELEAEAVLADPQAMDLDPGPIREHIAWLRTQAEVGIPMASSVGWSEDTGEREVPGDADLLEISLVGIPSDPRTTTTAAADETAMARAVAEASEGFDPDAFAAAYREAITAETVQAGTPVHVDGETPPTRNTVEVGGEEIDLTPPDAVQTAATLALAKADELDTDCGTGAGDQTARAVAGDNVTADRIDDIAAYLTSHEADVSADGPPSDWSDEQWRDCGNLQYAKWGGTGTGTGLSWAQDRANAVAAARGEELPYPDRNTTPMNTHNLDDPEFGEGDPVEWTSNDVIVRGRVADIGDEFSPAEGVTITGDEGEAVYLIHELDDSLDPPQYRRENVAKPESSLDESQADLPPLEGNFADDDSNENDMTDTPDDPDAGDDAGTDRDDPDGPDLRAMEEQMAELRGMMEDNTRMCREMHEEMMGGHGDEENAADADTDADADTADADTDADTDTERTVTLNGEEQPASEAVATLREEYESVDMPAPQTTDRAAADGDGDGPGTGTDSNDDPTPNWR